MKLIYASLFQVTLRHAFYADGLSREDFVVDPTPATRRLLDAAGLVMRTAANGFAVYAEVQPDTDPPVLWRPLADDAIRFAFALRLARPALLRVSDLPVHTMGETLFVFDNLRDDQADGRRHMGDSVADARIGDPVHAVRQSTFVYPFAAPVTDAVLSVTDRFGGFQHVTSVREAEPVATYALNLEAAGLSPGRYRITDDHGGQQDLYFAPGLGGERLFGIIELYSRTDPLTPDASDRVPVDYRFLDGSTLTTQGDYTVQFAARRTTWRYVVTKRYDSNTIGLDGLAVAGGAFTKTTSAQQALFESDTEVALSEAGQDFDLEHDGTKLIDLPSPTLQTPLQEGTADGHKTSELYIYV